MEVALRKKQYGGWWRGLGGETDDEGSGIPGDVDFSSGEVDPSTFYSEPGFNIPTAPGVDLTPAELAAEQKRATDWLAQLPNVLNATTKAALTASQITAGLQAGALKASSTCPGGYMVAGSAQCVAAAPAQAGLITGVPNSTLAIIGAGFLLLMVMSKSGGRR